MRTASSPGWLGVYATLYIVFLYAPVALLPIFALNDSTVIAFPLDGMTGRWFAELRANDVLHRSALNTVWVACTTAVVSTALAACAARAVTRFAFPAKRAALGFIMLPLVLPEIIVAVSLVVVLIQLGLSLSLWTVVAGHVLIATPFAIAILFSAFRGLDRSLEEASLDLGETRFGTFRRVTFPLVLPGIVASLLITFTISLDEFIIAFFLTGTDATLPVYIWSQLRFPAKLPGIMALGTVLFVLTVALIVAAEALRRWSRRRTGQDISFTGGAG